MRLSHLKALLSILLVLLPLLPSTARAASAATDSRELRSWADTIVREQMERRRIPGAVVSVVWKGEVVLAAGYGYADLATRRPVSAERTLFRVGSVSKPFTATAILQLAERGKLRLNADAGQYLEGVRPRPGSSRPVTIADLLTHTAGLDTTLLATSTADPTKVLPLGRYLPDRLPPFIRPPGRWLSYSNHGYTLLGLIVEKASGRPFDRYMDEEIFRPVGMYRSSFLPVPPHVADLAVGYEARESAVPVYPHIVPAAGLSTTGADMARFLLAHLEGGAVDGGRMLAAPTLREMHRRHFSQDPRMPGMAYGFFETFQNGPRGLFHGGGIRGFTSGLYLWPEHRLGIFVSNNGYNDAFVRAVVLRLLDRCFPPPEKATLRAPRGRHSRPDLGGVYRALSHPRSTFEKAGALRGGQELRVHDPGDGTLRIWGLPFVEVGPLLYQDAEGSERVAFGRDSSGRVTHLFTEEIFLGNETWERIPWYATASFGQQALLLCGLVFAAALFLRPVRHRATLTEAAIPEPPDLRRAVFLGVMVSALDLFFLALMLAGFRQAAAGAGLLYGLPPLMAVALAVPILSAALSLALPYHAARLWKRGYGPFRWRVFYTLLTLTAFGFITWLAFWNLLGYRT